MNNVAQVAVIGSGYWGKNLVRNFASLNALGTICDSDEVQLNNQLRLYPGVRGTTSFEQVLEDPALGAIVIATPAARHYEHVGLALRAGKDVFCEKPLALHYTAGRELADLAASEGRILMVGHVLEYHPAVVLLKNLVREGELGALRYIYSNRLNLGKVRTEENILWSFAPHDISVICTLADSLPIVVSASGGSYLQADVCDVTVSNLQFDGGVRAHIFVSWLHPYKEQRMVVIGDRKMAVFDDTAVDAKLRVYDKGIEWRLGQPIPRQTGETTLFFDQSEPLRLECEHFLDCIHTRREPTTNSDNALRVLKVLEASQASLDRGGIPIAVSSIGTET